MIRFKALLHKKLLLALALIVFDAIFFLTANASKVPSYLIIVGFVLITLTLYLLLSTLISLTKYYGLKLKHQRRLSLCLTGLLAGLLALQSIGELSVRDVLVILPLAIIGYIYMTLSASSQQID